VGLRSLYIVGGYSWWGWESIILVEELDGLARDPRGYGGRDRAGSTDLAISQTMVPWMGRVLFYSFPYGPASSFSPFLKSMFREKE
jgi:hypothetical protein